LIHIFNLIGAQLIPDRTETITIPAGTVDTVVVGWKSGNWNYIWIVDDFPFPVKALTYTWITTGIPPVMHQYTLLDYKENVTVDPFINLVETVPEEILLGCDTDFSDHVGKHVNTNTNTILIQYNYAPEFPMAGCPIDWRINFMNPYNDVEFIDQVHYDIWVVDEDGNRLRSYAQDLGRNDLYNGFGQVHLVFPVEENAGLVRYAIFVHGTGPEYQVPDAKMGGYAIVEIEIDENPLLEEKTILVQPPDQPPDQPTDQPPEIPSWIKNNAGWWAEGAIDDNSFIQGIQFLIKEGIMQIPHTSQGSGSGTNEIPDWVKNNAGWWAEGAIDDKSFVGGIQFLIKEGIMTISS